MYYKTTSSQFNEFGKLISRNQFQPGYQFDIEARAIQSLFVLNEDIVVSTKSGMTLLVCQNDKTRSLQQFVLHGEITINAGIAFNFIAITHQSQITTSVDLTLHDTNRVLHDPIKYQPIVASIQTKEIYAYFHQSKPSKYIFEGETLPYWELTYVDSGSLEMEIDNQTFRLEPLDIILSAPNQFHSQKVVSRKACTFLTIIFELNIESHPKLMNQIFKYNYQIRDLINQFIRFTNDDVYDSRWNDILISNLNMLISKLIISDVNHLLKTNNKTPQHRNFEQKMFTQITKFIEENIYEQIGIEDICHKFGISRTTLQLLFQNELNISPKLYINNLRLDIAKSLLREQNHNISEISIVLGFSSVQYFSKKFRNRFKISPRDYAKSNYN